MGTLQKQKAADNAKGSKRERERESVCAYIRIYT